MIYHSRRSTGPLDEICRPEAYILGMIDIFQAPVREEAGKKRESESERIPRHKNKQFSINVLYMLLLLAVLVVVLLLLVQWLKVLIAFFSSPFVPKPLHERIIIWWNIGEGSLGAEKNEPHKSRYI